MVTQNNELERGSSLLKTQTNCTHDPDELACGFCTMYLF